MPSGLILAVIVKNREVTRRMVGRRGQIKRKELDV